MNNQFNQDLFNQDSVVPATPNYSISFNWYDLMSLGCSYMNSTLLVEKTLQDVYGDNIYDVNGNLLSVLELNRLVFQQVGASWGIAVQSFNGYDLNNISITSFESSLADGGWVINKKYGNKSLSMVLYIQWTTHNDVIARIDDLKKNIQAVEWDLDIKIAWSARRYKATVSSIVIPSFKSLHDYVEWIEVEFLITSPHWESPTIQQTYVQNITTPTYSKVVDNIGTYKVYPVVQVITNTSSTLSSISITHKSVGDLTWYTITINETIPEFSVIIFDYVNKTVTVNWVEVNFSGIMMPIEINSSVFDFSFTWTIDVNTYILYNPTYL